MPEFALAGEVEALRDAAERLGRTALAPEVRAHETAGRWPDEVRAVLDGFPLGGLDLPEDRGGVGAGCVAKVVVLEALAAADAGGLIAADRPGPAAGAVLACPDRALALEAAGTCTFTVTEPDVPTRVAYAPAWPPPRWVFASEGDDLALYEVTGAPEPVVALAFQASGAVAIAPDALSSRGRWPLGPGAALAVRARARLWAAAVAVGVAQAALDETIAYTTERVVFGKPVAHHQGNAFDLAAAAAGVHAARLVVRDAAASFDRDEPDAGYWATQAALEALEAAFVGTNVGIQLLGGHGFIVDHLAEKRFREARHLALSWGGRDSAERDVAATTLDVPDELLGAPEALR
jgi:alkylation response protein AidB-like acyl-CoA dehydrogenase